MEMKNDCHETFSQELSLPKTISGLNLWPPQNPNVTTRDIYDKNNPIGYDEIQDELYVHPQADTVPSKQYRFWCASNRGLRRGDFVVNPEWISEDRSSPPKTVRTIGKVYEPSPVDFHGARDLHAKTWEQARIAPGHGVNPHFAVPGYAPYKHVPLSYRHAKDEIGEMWPWNQSVPVPESASEFTQQYTFKRPRTAVGAYYTHVPEDNSQFAKQLNDLHATHVQDRIDGGKPDIETREFTRSNREITYGHNRLINLDSNPYVNVDTYSKLPHPFGHGGHRELTDMFASTYSRNLPQMLFRKAQHAHAPWHAYMTFCDWGEPQMQSQAAA